MYTDFQLQNVAMRKKSTHWNVFRELVAGANKQQTFAEWPFELPDRTRNQVGFGVGPHDITDTGALSCIRTE